MPDIALLSPARMARRACDDLIMRGMVVADGDTLGISTTERIRVRFAAQGRRPRVPVAQLTVERIEPGAPQHPPGREPAAPWHSGG